MHLEHGLRPISRFLIATWVPLQSIDVTHNLRTQLLSSVSNRVSPHVRGDEEHKPVGQSLIKDRVSERLQVRAPQLADVGKMQRTTGYARNVKRCSSQEMGWGDGYCGTPEHS